MLPVQSTKTVVPETNYMLEYTVTKNVNECEPEGIVEYGIRCALFEREKMIFVDEIKCIAPSLSKVERLVRILRKNKVFPVHLKDVVYDLLVQEEEDIQTVDFCVA